MARTGIEPVNFDHPSQGRKAETTPPLLMLSTDYPEASNLRFPYCPESPQVRLPTPAKLPYFRQTPKSPAVRGISHVIVSISTL